MKGAAVKIGLISDIHCNAPGLRRALGLLDDCDEVLCAGDLMSQYRFSSEVLTIIKESGIRTIVGNHDKTILHAPAHPLRSSPTVDPALLQYLAGLPSTLSSTWDGMSIAMFHGSPWDDAASLSAHYVYPENVQDMRRVAQVKADIVVLGHTHRPFSARQGETLIVNPGSCGESRDPSGVLSCAMLDTRDGRVEHRYFSE